MEVSMIRETTALNPLARPAALLGIAFGTANGFADWISPLILLAIFVLGAIAIALFEIKPERQGL
jgi:hypothetical protein